MPKKEALSDKATLSEVMTEMCDQVFGKARIFLDSSGYTYSVSLPKVAFHDTQSAIPQAQAKAIVLPFAMPAGNFNVEVCFIEKKGGGQAA